MRSLLRESPTARALVALILAMTAACVALAVVTGRTVWIASVLSSLTAAAAVNGAWSWWLGRREVRRNPVEMLTITCAYPGCGSWVRGALFCPAHSYDALRNTYRDATFDRQDEDEDEEMEDGES